MNQKSLAILAAIAANSIYGINFTIGKNLMPQVIEPFGFAFFRISGAAVLFLLLSLFFPSEKIDRSDMLRFIACGLFGMSINITMLFKGLSLSTPINGSIIITLTPVIILIMSAVFLKEKNTWHKYIGISSGLIGALLLIFFGIKTQNNAANIPLGNILFLGGAFAYSTYFIIAKPLDKKYKPITLMKWFFLIASIISFPIGISEFSAVEWSQLFISSDFKLAFVLIGATFFTFLLNIYALKQMQPSTIGVFIYLQPIVGVLFAIIVDSYSLSPIQIGAATLIFIGVFLSTRKSKKP